MSTYETWGMNLFVLDRLVEHRPLTAVTYTIFRDRDLLRVFQIPGRTLVAFIATLEDHYHKSNPFHNNIHAADVTQSINVLLNTRNLEVTSSRNSRRQHTNNSSLCSRLCSPRWR